MVMPCGEAHEEVAAARQSTPRVLQQLGHHHAVVGNQLVSTVRVLRPTQQGRVEVDGLDRTSRNSAQQSELPGLNEQSASAWKKWVL